MSNLSAFGLAPVYDLLAGFAHLDDFWGLFATAFGTQYDRSVVDRLSIARDYHAIAFNFFCATLSILFQDLKL